MPPISSAFDPLPSGRARSLRSGLLIGATSVALTFTVLPGTAVADPAEATTPEQATQLVAEASHELEVVTEELNTAKVELEQHQAAAAAAEQDAADAREQLGELDDQIRQIARTAYTSDGLSELDVMLSSDSAEEFLSSAGHPRRDRRPHQQRRSPTSRTVPRPPTRPRPTPTRPPPRRSRPTTRSSRSRPSSRTRSTSTRRSTTR